jgi:hypothetical protein
MMQAFRSKNFRSFFFFFRFFFFVLSFYVVSFGGSLGCVMACGVAYVLVSFSFVFLLQLLFTTLLKRSTLAQPPILITSTARQTRSETRQHTPKCIKRENNSFLHDLLTGRRKRCICVFVVCSRCSCGCTC